MITRNQWSRTSRLLLLAVSLLLALVTAEIVVRVGFSERFGPPPYPFRPDEQYVFDSARGYYHLRPSQAIKLERPYPPGRTDINTQIWVSNRDGFRYRREFDEFDERARILVLGDSFVFGLGVEEPERFTELIETLEADWRVDNLGMNGYGLDLMLRAFSAVGLKAKPKLVAICIYSNDLMRAWPEYAGMGFEIPRFSLRAGRLVSVPFPKRRFLDESHLFGLLKHLYWTRTNASYDLNGAILDRFVALSHEHSFRLALAFLPQKIDSPREQERRSWLGAYADRKDLPFLDLTFAINSLRPEKMYLPKDVHWSPYGHQVVATEMHRFFRELLAGK